MFLLSLYGKSQIYTTQAKAEQAAARYLMGVMGGLCIGKDKQTDFNQFRNAFQREKYDDCVRVWNVFAKKEFLGSYHYQAIIEAAVANEAFV